MKKILLIRPEFATKGLYCSYPSVPFLSAKAFMAPLDLATLAGITPDGFDVELWDEQLRGPITEATKLPDEYDLVGITGYLSHVKRAIELGQFFRRRRVPVVVGGPGVSGAPELYREHFDVLFLGEGEYTWPQFLDDFASGGHRREYRQVTKVDLADSPPPKWDKIATDMEHYLLGLVQTMRGCPYDCEFCDVIHLFGRRVRNKGIERVLEEVRLMERLGARDVFFCDDNFYGIPKYAKALLGELIPLNRSFRRPLGFHTQISVDIALDDEMLALLADANFNGLLIGIESPNVESLKEANKRQNLRTDMLQAAKKIQSYGMIIDAAMIVGFDNDDTSIFQRHFDFLHEAGIAASDINVLKGWPGTKLWARLQKEKRLFDLYPIASSDSGGTALPVTNMFPKRMTLVELLSGYRDLLTRLADWDNFEARVKAWVLGVKRSPVLDRRYTTWKRMFQFIWFLLFGRDRQTRASARRLFRFTMLRRPLVFGRVVPQLIKQYAVARDLPASVQTIEDQIRLAETGMLRPLENPVFLVPDAFKKPYKAIFPELHQRVYCGLIDKSRTDEALIDAVYDFLTRVGPALEHFEDGHRHLLCQICDNTIATENGTAHGQNRAAPAEQVAVADRVAGEALPITPDIRRSRLADEVLNGVELKLRSFRPRLEADNGCHSSDR